MGHLADCNIKLSEADDQNGSVEFSRFEFIRQKLEVIANNFEGLHGINYFDAQTTTCFSVCEHILQNSDQSTSTISNVFRWDLYVLRNQFHTCLKCAIYSTQHEVRLLIHVCSKLCIYSYVLFRK